MQKRQPDTTHLTSQLRAEMAAANVRHNDVADLLGLTAQQFSLYINNRRTLPPDWPEQAHQAIERVKEANDMRSRFLTQTT